jgi:hypothetical protein
VPANSDPNYRALREAVPAETFAVERVSIIRDIGQIVLRKGTIAFTTPVLGRTPIAIFVGDGEFRLAPTLGLERNYLRSLTEKEEIVDTFERAVFAFGDKTEEEIRKAAEKRPTLGDARVRDTLNDFRNRVRNSTETPRSMLEYMFRSDDMENVDAELLTDLYNPSRPGSFRAFLFGRKYGDLRFMVRPLGAIPGLPAPEEVALIHLDPGGAQEGILYLSHHDSENKARTASSGEDKRIVAAEHYTIETAVGGNEHLKARTTVRVRSVLDGDRVISFGLLPSLRVSSVKVAGKETSFIQEDRKKDGSFYVVMPEAMKKGQTYEITVEYAGDRVIRDAGGGNFAVGARTSWYPSLNAFTDQATYDLTFRVPSRYQLVSVGKLVGETVEQGQSVTKWRSEVPLAVAGFNYGEFRKKQLIDEPTDYRIEGYAARELPGYLQNIPQMASASPSRLIDKTLAETQASMRIFTDWFGAAPYGRIAITQQPEFSFGQSWPGLVYLPMSAFLDSTQRWQLMGSINRGLTEFIQEVTAHEVAHQWWGHMVTWASFHDQWLSEGFADFSAGIFLQLTEKDPQKYWKYLEHSRDAILDKNNYGRSANDAGPLWMGLRLSTHKNAGAYNRLVYPKGGYVLHMLRMMMWDPKTGDQAFKEMMREFVRTHLHKRASTESFLAVVNRHIKPNMDLTGRKSMDWFFSQWVFGTEVPRYKLDYTVTPKDDQFLLKATVTQSDVGPNFAMPVPIYLDFDGRLVRIGQVTMIGSSTNDKIEVMLPKKPRRVLLNANYDVLAQK